LKCCARLNSFLQQQQQQQQQQTHATLLLQQTISNTGYGMLTLNTTRAE
jgi:hypothetical protein